MSVDEIDAHPDADRIWATLRGAHEFLSKVERDAADAAEEGWLSKEDDVRIGALFGVRRAIERLISDRSKFDSEDEFHIALVEACE